MARKQRKYSPKFKFQVVMEVLTGAKRPGEVCREHQISDSLLSRWRKEFLARGHEVFEPQGRRSQESARIAELERVLGQTTVELAAAKKASGWLDSLP